jgi:hypothetical protein
MPILMVALIALAAFGLIGFLLAAAVVCESKTASHADLQPPSKAAAAKPVR